MLVLVGPAGTMGELTLVSDTVLRVNPFRASIQSTQDSKQGAYTVTNDDLMNLAITGRHASQYRRSLVLVYVADSVVSGVASSGTTDGTFLTILDGPLAASNPALPSAVPPNALLLGELSIPPVGVGAVTMTPYNPRTTLRGGILPVLATDTVAGLHLGEYRDHPTLGLQRWVPARGWVSQSPTDFARCFAYADTRVTGWAAGWQNMPLNAESIDTHNGHNTGVITGSDTDSTSRQNRYTVQPGQAGRYKVGGGIIVSVAQASALNSRLVKNGNVFFGWGGNQTSSTVANGSSTGEKIIELGVGEWVGLQGFCNVANWNTEVFSDASTWMSVERID